MILTAPFLGSFIGAAASRWPLTSDFATGRSRCDWCKRTIALHDLIPLISWIQLSGRCRYCSAAIHPCQPIAEGMAVAVAVWAAVLMQGWVLAAGCGLGWTLLLLALIDARTQRLPDALTLPLLAAGLLVAWAIDPGTLADHVIGAAAGFVALALLSLLYRRLRGREGLGLGDAKLLGALGAWLGWRGLPVLVLVASILGLLFALAWGRRPKGQDRIAFGPFLALAGWIVWLYGPA